MAKLNPSRAAQTVLSAEFTFEFADTMKDVNGVTKDFKTVGTHVFDAINLPPRATVVGGEVVTETAVTGSTAYNVSVGDSGSATRYLGVTNKLSAGRTALVPTGYVATVKTCVSQSPPLSQTRPLARSRFVSSTSCATAGPRPSPTDAGLPW